MFKPFSVYLAGAIRYDFTTKEINSYDVDWRYYVKEQLRDYFNVILPIDLNNEPEFKEYQYMDERLQQYIYNQDMSLIEECDILLANLIPFTKDNYPMLGTLYEIGYANKDIPVVIIIEEDSPFEDHPMYVRCIKTYSINDAINKCIDYFYSIRKIDEFNNHINRLEFLNNQLSIKDLDYNEEEI